MKYAVIKIGGHQFKVQEKDKITVDQLALKEGETAEVKDVLLLNQEGKVRIGKPMLDDVRVTLKVDKHLLGEKLEIFKFKAKTGYRRKIGFRSKKSLVLIEKITP